MPRKLTPAPPGMKFCPYCWTCHPVAAFAADASRSDGLRQYCRSGTNAALRRSRHRAKVRARRGSASLPAEPNRPPA